MPLKLRDLELKRLWERGWPKDKAYEPVKIDKPVEELPVVEDGDNSHTIFIASAGHL